MTELLVFFYITVLCTLSWNVRADEAVCGGIVEASSGEITSPGYPEPYPANISCVWDIHTPIRTNITLIFNHLDLDSETTNCPNGDFILIWGELNGQSFWRNAAICGNLTEPMILRNVDNRVRVLFKSNGTGEKAGFSVVFTSALETECGGELTSTFGEISSPLYPNDYPSNRRCVWDIIAPVGHKITLNFTDFDLENRTSTCPDKVILWSRSHGRYFRRQVKFCGNQIPPSFRSQDNRLRIEFKSDRTVESRGFSAIFYSDDHDVENECNEHQFRCARSHHCIPKLWQCDGFDDCGDMSDEGQCEEADTRMQERRHKGNCVHSITSPQGEILSPSYRVEDVKGRDCSWHFNTKPGHRIQLRFNYFALLEHPDVDQDCQVDRITFYEGPDRFSPVLDYFCGLQDLPLRVTSKTNDLFVTLKTISNTFWKGFNLTHSTVCGGLYKATEQTARLYSHLDFGKNNYGPNITCLWSLHTAQDRRIQLDFTQFEVCQNKSDDVCVDSSVPNSLDVTEQNCHEDYVEISEDRDSVEVRIAQFCGKTIPNAIISTGNSLKILFITNDIASSKGFSASYRSISNGVPPSM